MRLLLDTHAFAWALAREDRLPPRILDLITDPRNTVCVSAAAVYELDYKRAGGGEIGQLPQDLIAAGHRQGYDWLAISSHHARAAARLDRVHRDPWDRIIAAQGLVEDMFVVTKDPAFLLMGASVLW